MRPSVRTWFLLIVASVAFKLSNWNTAVLLIGYGIAEHIDQWRARKAREELYESEIVGWEQSKDDPEWEDKGGLTRVRLAGPNQIIVTRVAELLRRTL